MAEVLELLRFGVVERTGDQVRGECPLATEKRNP
jgi:hypothetical protein